MAEDNQDLNHSLKISTVSSRGRKKKKSILFTQFCNQNSLTSFEYVFCINSIDCCMCFKLDPPI